MYVNIKLLGDLSKAAAFKYYELVIGSKHPEAKRELFPSEADFDKVFYITGGRMVYIDEYVDSVAKSGSQPTGELAMLVKISSPDSCCLVLFIYPVESSGLVMDAVSKLAQELKSDTGSRMLRIMEKLSLSESEYLTCNPLDCKFDWEVVWEMIRKDLLHLRSLDSISGDIPPMDISKKPFLTASSVPVLRAMQLITKDCSKQAEERSVFEE